jgi:hypothetical protein
MLHQKVAQEVRRSKVVKTHTHDRKHKSYIRIYEYAHIAHC